MKNECTARINITDMTSRYHLQSLMRMFATENPRWMTGVSINLYTYDSGDLVCQLLVEMGLIETSDIFHLGLPIQTCYLTELGLRSRIIITDGQYYLEFPIEWDDDKN